MHALLECQPIVGINTVIALSRKFNDTVARVLMLGSNRFVVNLMMSFLKEDFLDQPTEPLMACNVESASRDLACSVTATVENAALSKVCWVSVSMARQLRRRLQNQWSSYASWEAGSN
jgi:hypothetical protein